jgi:predicted DNA-binding transcriptional regulator AlpA
MTTDLEPAATGVRVYPDGRISAQDAARYCGLSYKTMALQRSAGVGPAFVKLGKAVFYRKDDLDQWMSSCRVQSTSEYRARNQRQRLGGE